MKKILVFFVIGLLIFGSCSAQNVNAQSSNDAQRIVGTWISSEFEFVFNANGTGTLRPGQELIASITEEFNAAAVAEISANIHWGVSISGQIYISFNFSSSNNRDISDFQREISREFRNEDIFLSPDSRRMILAGEVFQKR